MSRTIKVEIPAEYVVEIAKSGRSFSMDLADAGDAAGVVEYFVRFAAKQTANNAHAAITKETHPTNFEDESYNVALAHNRQILEGLATLGTRGTESQVLTRVRANLAKAAGIKKDAKAVFGTRADMEAATSQEVIATLWQHYTDEIESEKANAIALAALVTVKVTIPS